MITRGDLMDTVVVMASSGEFDNYHVTNFTEKLKNKNITLDDISANFVQLVNMSIAKRYYNFLKYLNVVGRLKTVDNTTNIIFTAIETNDIQIVRLISNYSGVEFSTRNRIFAIRHCTPDIIKVLYTKSFKKSTISSTELGEACTNDVTWEIVLPYYVKNFNKSPMVAKSSILKTVALNLLPICSAEQIIQLLNMLDFDFSTDNNTIPMDFIALSTEATKDTLISYFLTYQNVVKTAIANRQELLIPQTLKKIFLIKDKK